MPAERASTSVASIRFSPGRIRTLTGLRPARGKAASPLATTCPAPPATVSSLTRVTLDEDDGPGPGSGVTQGPVLFTMTCTGAEEVALPHVSCA